MDSRAEWPPPRAMATRNSVLTTAKALVQALRQADSDVPADPAPFFFRIPPIPPFPPPLRWHRAKSSPGDTIY